MLKLFNEIPVEVEERENKNKVLVIWRNEIYEEIENERTICGHVKSLIYFWPTYTPSSVLSI